MVGITLQEFADAKNSSVEDVLIYALTKGVSLGSNPDYVISASTLKLIDPVFFFQLRTAGSNRQSVTQLQNQAIAGHIPPKQQGEDVAISESVSLQETIVPKKHMILATASGYFGHSWADISAYLNSIGMPIVLKHNTRLTDEQYNALNSHFGKAKKLLLPFDDVLLCGEGADTFIGAVQFYDARCNKFGFISTNALYNSSRARTTLRIDEKDIDSGILSEDELVFFKPIPGRATHVSVISYSSPINWYCALRYIKEYDTIHVERRKGADSIISQILDKIIGVNTGGLVEAILSILEALDSTPQRQLAFLDEYLVMPCIYDAVRLIIESGDYSYKGTSRLLIDKIVSIAVAENNFNLFFTFKEKFSKISLPKEMPDAMRCEAFVRYKDTSILSSIVDVSNRSALIANSIKSQNQSVQISLLNILDESLKEELLSQYLQNTSVGKIFLREKWDGVKSSLPYVVFDIESDGEIITQFTFKQEDNIREYIGEQQLKSLGRALKKQAIVVGHNIRIWDLPILKDKGIITDNFVWDTLEMEILLNPCRYAYSLHTEHNATADTKLTDKLFWNQLYRLSQDQELCSELKDFLPAQIDSILEVIRQPQYAELLLSEAHVGMQFFQELIEPSASLVSILKSLNNVKKRSLLIAPRNLWSRIAQYVRVAFPKTDDEYSFMTIDYKLVKDSKELGAMKKCVLLRFAQMSKTPVVSNLAQYLRVEKISNDLIQISDSIISEYTTKAISHIDCIDIDAFSVPNILATEYNHIYIVGSELQDRMHKCQLGKSFAFSELIAIHSKLPFRMASTSFCPVDDDELLKLGLIKPSLTANVWAERDDNGLFSIYHNYEYQVYRNNFFQHYKNIVPEFINWELEYSDFDRQNIIIYATAKKANFDSSFYRLNSSTTIRSKYWTYQFAMLLKIHEQYPSLPIVYVINSLKEVGALTEYARKLGFYVPQEGTSFRKIEYISCHKNGLIIIDKNQFLNSIGGYRTDQALCFVWDNMDVERYQLMWRKLPFEKDPIDNNDDIEIGSVGSTAKQCIFALWPIFEHYYSLIAANNRDSKLCIIEPTIEEYSDVSDLVGCAQRDLMLWDNNDSYTMALSQSKMYFADESISDKIIEVEEAMGHIKDNFLREGKDWYDYQRDVLPIILQKQSDCIVSIPTGGGKSVLFQGPAIYRAAFSHKLSIVITPLRALMQDQVEELHAKGFYTNVDYLSGDKIYAQVKQIYRRIASGEIALLYVTPERFRVRSFMNVLFQRMEMDNGLEYIVYDEAHCISQWGQDFRPDYRNALQKCVELKERFPFMMAFFSATITAQVENDLRSQVSDLIRIGQSSDDYNPIRSHIGINFEKCQHEDTVRIETIAQFIVDKNINFSKSRMLIFCRTHKQCEEVTEGLENIFISSNQALLDSCAGHITYFHAGLDSERRNDVYEQFKSEGEDRYYILCATKAFGMGMDIPNVHYVVHFNPPPVMEDYLQEVGRAGRDKTMYESAFSSGNHIPALCLTSSEDFAKLKDLLIKSLMKWSDLEDARSKVISFINRFQTIEQTHNQPIVLPYSFWQKNDSVSSVEDTTLAKLALHWLDYIGYIKQGYISLAYLDVTLLNQNLQEVYNGLSKKKDAKKLFDYVRSQVSVINQPSLISIVDLRDQLHFSMPRLFDAFIECQKYGLLSLNSSMQCVFKPRRYVETRYMIDNNKNIFALHILMEGMRSVLSDCKVDQERIVHPTELEDICSHLLDEVQYETITKVKTKRDKKPEETICMPWHGYLPSAPKGAVTKAETFKKNIVTRAGRRIFSIMNFIPGVCCEVKNVGGDVCQVITIKKSSDWFNYSKQLENDCWSWLNYIQTNESIQTNNGNFEWVNAIIKLQWDASQKKGYKYFEDILAILRMISYIDYTPTIQTGIEVYTTDKTLNKWDAGELKDSPYHNYREEFNDQEAMKKIRLTAMNIFTVISSSQQGDYIKKYFLCRSYTDFLNLVGEFVPEGSAILSQLKEEALKKEESRLEGNIEQQAIYRADKSKDINILAGPGSGKTHILTLRCAKLIYREAVDPSQIMVLAYNRAVVAELRIRLDNLFVKLGMSRVAHQLHVYTFHALARKTLAVQLDNYNTNEWENEFKKFLKLNAKDFRAIYPNIRHIMIDEFQDITQDRLDALLELHNIYPNAKFFTIGDINQSIYGFNRVPRNFKGTPEDYAQWLDPLPYYAQLREKLSPSEMQMFTNYRSYQDILNTAAVFLPEGNRMPTSASSLMEHELEKPYVFVTDNTQNKDKQWFNDLFEVVQKAKAENDTNDPNRHIRDIAIFFRTNAEVYRGFSKIKNSSQMLDKDIRIRIQGAGNTELWRNREFFEVINHLEESPNRIVSLRNSETQNELRSYVVKLHTHYDKWDTEYLDITYSLILNYLVTIRADEEDHTWGEIATYIREIAGKDDGGQVYKIFDQHQSSHLWPDNRLTIVLTTMHKVKGLEFDIVIITPSFADLPLIPHRNILVDELAKEDDLADIAEEKRLLFVAYTRAKKFLHVYKWERELAIERGKLFQTPSGNKLIYFEKDPGLDKYFLSYTAQTANFDIDTYIRKSIKKDDPVDVFGVSKNYKGKSYYSYEIRHKGQTVGQLSSKSNIAYQGNKQDIKFLKGFFVSDIFIWTYQETQDADIKNNTTTKFANMWCEAAKKQGYITIVQIAGFGEKE